MNEAAKQARREYQRKWNAAHRDKVKEYQERYWNRKAQEAAEAAAAEQNDEQEAAAE